MSTLARQFLTKSIRPTVIFKAFLNNYSESEEGFEDWACGDVETCGINPDVNLNNNSVVKIANNDVLRGGTVYNCMQGGVQFLRSIGAPLTVDSTIQTGKVKIGFNTDPSRSFDLQNREFKGRRYEIEVGGTENEDRQDTKILPYSDYLPLLRGKINNATHNRDQIFVSLNTIPSDLQNQFPKNTYTGTGGTEGDENNEGKTKPYICGQVFNETPEDLGNGLRQFHDGDGAVLTEVFSEGVALAYVAGDPLIDTPVLGQFMSNSSGFFKTHPDQRNVTYHATGALINGSYSASADHIIAHIVDTATGGRYSVADLGGDWDIGITFKTQKPVITYVRELVASLDYICIHEDDGNMRLKHRFNNQYYDFQGNINPVNDFEFSENNMNEGSIKWDGDSERYSRYRVGYRKNHTIMNTSNLPSATRRSFSTDYLFTEKSSVSPIESGIKEATRTVATYLVNKADAIKFAALVFRDSLRRRKYSFSVVDHRWILEEGMVGNINHPVLGGISSKFEITSVSDDTSSLETKIVGYLI